METLYIIIIAVLSNLYSMAQQNPASQVAEIALPKEANKMNKEQTLAFVQKNFKHLKILNDYNNTYYIDKVGITVRDQQIPPDDKLTLEMHKRMTEDFNKRYGGTIVDSKIITVNNIRFFIFEDEVDQERNLIFTSDFKNGKMICCLLKYKKEDEDKAQAIFKKIINTVRYKN